MLKIINELLAKCKAVPFTEAIAGGQFYRVMSQKFKLPNGTIITREFLDKKPAAAVVPITTDGKVVCVIQPASLTEEGSKIANNIYERHTLFTEWLIRIGVNPKTAEEDACQIEHAISDESFAAIKKYIKKK